ncbi:hypothetical protein LO772_15150 [Yinghuangia sp. ASG 101]|uniref:DUF6879 family protein n=1 Tax=Yinghuangia sp. ASG 101 TaxID=2896848 RepID=UPI001E385750|nr:DUF6879 family protein [Yinghuangia sp. ASG 101]UGQ14787.1 hypothetical protein LO772_15150 [Yinghuangia sp. ASG 101]
MVSKPVNRADTFFAATRHSALHWELRDDYTPDSEEFAAWRRGWRPEASDAEYREGFYADVAAMVARGVDVRRLRVVSEPITEYVRYEHALTFANIDAGEKVRWLPRSSAVDLLVPALDGWVFDRELLLTHHWSGRGDLRARRVTRDPGVVQLYAEAFESLWPRGVPHEDYVIR